MDEDLLRANARYAERFDGVDLRPEPASRLVVLTCMDTRLDVHGILGLRLGDAHILRNAGGRVTDDVIRSLIVSTELLGTRSVAVIQHTDCGMTKTTDEELRALVAGRVGSSADRLEFHTVRRQEEAVRGDVELLRNSSLLLPGLTVSGFLYDVHTGRLAPLTPTSDDRAGRDCHETS